jgi:hypothetical protein
MPDYTGKDISREYDDKMQQRIGLQGHQPA